MKKHFIAEDKQMAFNHKGSCSASLTVRKMQIKTRDITMTYRVAKIKTLTLLVSGKDIEKVNHQSENKAAWSFWEDLTVSYKPHKQLPLGPAVVPFGMCAKEMKAYVYIKTCICS